MSENLIWFWLCIGLIFVIEGIYPTIAPDKWRNFILSMAKANDKTIRKFGLLSMIFGALLIALVHNLYRV